MHHTITFHYLYVRYVTIPHNVYENIPSQRTHTKIIRFSRFRMDQIRHIATENMPNNINKYQTGWK